MTVYNGSIKYEYGRVKIIACTAPMTWYADRIGKVIEVQRRTYKKYGLAEGVAHYAFDSTRNSYSKLLKPSDIEEL